MSAQTFTWQFIKYFIYHVFLFFIFIFIWRFVSAAQNLNIPYNQLDIDTILKHFFISGLIILIFFLLVKIASANLKLKIGRMGYNIYLIVFIITHYLINKFTHLFFPNDYFIFFLGFLDFHLIAFVLDMAVFRLNDTKINLNWRWFLVLPVINLLLVLFLCFMPSQSNEDEE